VSVVAYHGYGYKNFDKLASLKAKYPDLPFWMDEFCYAYEAGIPPAKSFQSMSSTMAIYWGNNIFSDLEAGTSAWLYWNAILDETGGPWAVSVVHGNPDPNVQHPVVIINKATREVTYTGTYYYLAHFSRFVRPGAVRVQTTGKSQGVRVMAFQTLKGGFVVQFLNSLNSDGVVDLVSRGRTLGLTLPARSITTATW